MWLLSINKADTNDQAKVLRRLQPRDHFGGSGESVLGQLNTFLAANGSKIDSNDEVLLLTNLRKSNYVFNPLSVFWNLDANKKIKWIVLEIHNTYGERHAHFLEVDRQGRAEFSKEFYVSPFFQVQGEYKFQTKLSDNQVLVSVNLYQDKELVFTSSYSGKLEEARLRWRIRANLLYPFMTYQVMARIKFHGIWLWLKKLPVIPRPVHVKQQGML